MPNQIIKRRPSNFYTNTIEYKTMFCYIVNSLEELIYTVNEFLRFYSNDQIDLICLYFISCWKNRMKINMVFNKVANSILQSLYTDEVLWIT